MEIKENDYTGFIYLWYDRKHKWFCLGSHMGTVDDGYVTSTGYMKKAYRKRPDDFKRRILYYHYGDQKSLLGAEQKILDRIKLSELHNEDNKKSNTTRYYNMKKNASGLSGEVASKLKTDYWNSTKSDVHREKNRIFFQENNPSHKEGYKPWNTGLKCPQISKAKKGKKSTIPFEVRSEISKRAWAAGCFDNRPKPTEEHKRKISESGRALNRKQTDYQKQRSREANSAPKTEEHKEKLSKIAKERSLIMQTCYRCGFIGSGPVMQRWHMSNCKK